MTLFDYMMNDYEGRIHLEWLYLLYIINTAYTSSEYIPVTKWG